MVARPTDNATGVTERLADQRKKHDELTRSVGRGTSALRSVGDSILEMADAATPLLKSDAVNVGISFTANGELEIVTKDGASYRNLRSNDVKASNNLIADKDAQVAGSGSFGGNGTFGGEVRVTSGIRTEAGLSCALGFSAGGTIFGPGMKIGEAENPVGGRITCREITAEGNIFAKGSMFVNGNFVDNTPSEFRLKNHHEDITNGIQVINSLRPSIWTWKDQKNRDDKVHAGIYVDELADVAPEAIVEPVNPDDIPTEDENFFTDKARNYEDRAVIAYLVSAMQQMHREHVQYKDKTEKELFDLRCDVDDLKESVQTLLAHKRLAN